jgi:hypothetical protein
MGGGVGDRLRGDERDHGCADRAADTSTLGATHDTYSSQNNPTTTHGGHTSLTVNAAPGERRAYLRFAVTGIPDGSTATP